MGMFNFGTNVTNVVHKTTNDTVNSFVQNTGETSTATVSCDQALTIGDITACPDFTTNQVCDLSIKNYQTLDQQTVTAVMTQLTANIVNNISQEASKQVGGFFGVLDDAIPGLSVQTNVTNTKDDIKNTLTNEQTINAIVKASSVLTAKQGQTLGNINCQGYKFGEIKQTVLVDMFSMQTANIVVSSLTQNQSYVTMVNNVTQRVKTVATGGALFLIIVLIIVVLIIIKASKHANKLNKKNLAKLAKYAA